MKFGNFADGVAILAKYQTDRDEHCICARHDQLFVCSDALPLSAEDKAEMERLGWFEDEESWACFT